MKRIKFRAWDKVNKRICDIYCLNTCDNQAVIHTQDPFCTEGCVGLDRLIIMQFTGYYDANGREVFEGDIWKRDTFVGQIAFEFGQWCINKLPSSGCYQYPAFHSNIGTGIIMGNIYENPVLCKKLS